MARDLSEPFHRPRRKVRVSCPELLFGPISPCHASHFSSPMYNLPYCSHSGPPSSWLGRMSLAGWLQRIRWLACLRDR